MPAWLIQVVPMFLPLLGEEVAKRLLLAARRETGEKESQPLCPFFTCGTLPADESA